MTVSVEEAYGQFLLGWQKCIDKISSRCEEELNQCKVSPAFGIHYSVLLVCIGVPGDLKSCGE